MRIDGFFGDTRDVAHRSLDALAIAPERAVRDFHQPGDDGSKEDAEQREAPVHIEQVDEQSQDGEAVAHELDCRAGRGGRHQLDVIGEFREQMPGLLLIQIGRGQAQVVREHIASQTLDDLPADPAGKIGLHVVAHATQRE
jgi:hypothetical protein